MTDRTALGAGCVYCGVFPLLFYVPYVTFYMRLPELPRLALLPFCLAMALIYLGNALVLRRGPTVPVLAVCNVPLWGGTLGAVLALSRFHALGQTLFAVVLVLAGCIICVYTAFSPITIPKLLTQCDVIALSAVWMCLLEAGGAVSASTLLFYLAALLLVLFALLALRTFGSSRDVVYGSRLWGGLMSVGLLGVIGGLLYLFIHFLSGASRTAVGAVFFAVGAFFLTVSAALGRFFTWLFSFWTPEEIEGAPPEMEAAPSLGGGDELVEAALDPRIFLVLGIILVLIVAGGLVFFLIRMRKHRLRLEAPELRRERTGGRRRTGALAKWWRALWFRIRFRAVFLFHRNSPTGLLVWLEGWGARHGTARGKGETHRAYLLRLAAQPALKDSPEVPQLLGQLADVLDRRYFGGARDAVLPAGAAAVVRRRLGRVPRPKKEPALEGGQR